MAQGATAGNWSAFNAFGIPVKTQETLEQRLLWLAEYASKAAQRGDDDYRLIVFSLKKMLAEIRIIYFETHGEIPDEAA